MTNYACGKLPYYFLGITEELYACEEDTSWLNIYKKNQLLLLSVDSFILFNTQYCINKYSFQRYTY